MGRAAAGEGFLARVSLESSAASRRTVAGRFALLDPTEAGGLDAAWRTLEENAAEDNLSFTSDFAVPAMAALGPAVRIATWRGTDGALSALAPAVDTKLGRIAPAAALWTHPYGPQGTPLVDRARIVDAVFGLLGGLGEGRSLVLPELWLDGPVTDAIRAFAAMEGRPVAVVEQQGRVLLRRGGRPVDCRAALPTRRRKGYGRQMRRLAEEGVVAIETARSPDDVKRAFADFLSLESSGWKGARGTALAKIGPIAAMAEAIVTRRAEGGRMRIQSLRLDGRPLAMLLTFIAGRTAATWKIGYDETMARFSPGAQLMLEAGTSLLAEPDIAEVDSCAHDDHPMIAHLWKDRRAIGTMVIGPPGGGLLFKAGLAAMRAEMAGRAIAKRLVNRLRGR